MSSQSYTTLTLTLIAAGAVTLRRAVGMDGTQAGAGESCLGIADTTVASGEQLAVAISGTAEVEAGAAFAIDADLTPDANGKLVAAVPGDYVVARALAASSADGDIVEVLLKPPVNPWRITEVAADPADPAEGTAVIWMSDGTGTGDDGDILIKVTAGATTKTATLVDFSAV